MPGGGISTTPGGPPSAAPAATAFAATAQTAKLLIESSVRSFIVNGWINWRPGARRVHDLARRASCARGSGAARAHRQLALHDIIINHVTRCQI